ncbi:MAG: phosphoribosylanthranilate isomerase [Pseudomonadota bacterium]
MDIAIKFCGLTRPADIAAATAAGARYIGFVFFPKSPRAVTPQHAAFLAEDVPPDIAKVGLIVDMDDAQIAALLDEAPLDMLQLHGHETPHRVAEVKARFGLPVIKAVGITDAADLSQLEDYGTVADQLLVDAKAPRGSNRPGGNAIAFDWSLISGRRWPIPWLLAGGLTPDNAAEAVRVTGAKQVDVSSGIESEPGMKDPSRMQAFAAAISRA